MEKNKYLGFTLIELLVVIAIIGILAIIAVPSYNTYISKSQVVDGVATANRVKDFTINFYLKYNQMPQNTDLANEFATTVSGGLVPVTSGPNSSNATAYIGYPTSSKTNETYSIIQLKKSVGTAGQNTFYIGIKVDTNGSFIVKCGIWNPAAPLSANDITNISYFPTGCNATDVYTTWQ